jgi:hypothetical protein
VRVDNVAEYTVIQYNIERPIQRKKKPRFRREKKDLRSCEKEVLRDMSSGSLVSICSDQAFEGIDSMADRSRFIL